MKELNTSVIVPDIAVMVHEQLAYGAYARGPSLIVIGVDPSVSVCELEHAPNEAGELLGSAPTGMLVGALGDVDDGSATGAIDAAVPDGDVPAPLDSVTVATKPAACTESSAKNWMLSKGPVDTIGCGNVGPENVPRRLLPSYTYTLS